MPLAGPGPAGKNWNPNLLHVQVEFPDHVNGYRRGVVLITSVGIAVIAEHSKFNLASFQLWFAVSFLLHGTLQSPTPQNSILGAADNETIEQWPSKNWAGCFFIEEVLYHK